MKYAIIGIGAIGTIIGGYITKTGKNIIFFGKKTQINSINKSGIIIDEYKINNKINATDNFKLLKDIDIVLICVKSTDTENVANKIKDNIKKTALIISLQNGLNNAQILESITGNITLSAIVTFNAISSKPGIASITMKGGIILENNLKQKDKIRDIFLLLKKANFKIQIVDNIQPILWNKIIINSQNAITALTGNNIKESLRDKNSRKIIKNTLREGIYILEKSGYKIKLSYKLNPKITLWTFSIFGYILLIPACFIKKLKEKAKNSMLQSMLKGKNTEIDYINGEITQLAKKNNLKAPINSKLIELIKNLEKQKEKNYISSMKLIKILGL